MILKPTPQERAMKMHELLVRTLAGEFTWIQAADRMGVSPRTMRRWRLRLETRVVQKDNTVGWEGARLQIPKQPARSTCAGIPVFVRHHLDHTYSVWRGPKCLAQYDSRGRIQASNATASNPIPGTEAAA